MLTALNTWRENHATTRPDSPPAVTGKTAQLTLLLKAVSATGYSFITPTPLTHQRVLDRQGIDAAKTLRDIFGWSLPFKSEAVAPDLLSLMHDAGVLVPLGELLHSTVRVSSIDDDLFLHTAYPTVKDDAVFFGPDTYRFARFIQNALRTSGEILLNTGGGPCRVLDVGCGSGAGAMVAARTMASLRGNPGLELTMNDINPLALAYASANAAHGGLSVKLAEGDALSAVAGRFNLIISNPPYLDDAAQRAYRHGGKRLGRALSVRIAQEALGRLAPGGQLLLYTGVAIVKGLDDFRAEMLPLLDKADCTWSYSEIDPDVFGEELDQPAYAHVDRIAAVGLIATRRGGKG